jgi:membrane associated rhomboid family serine protease
MNATRLLRAVVIGGGLIGLTVAINFGLLGAGLGAIVALDGGQGHNNNSNLAFAAIYLAGLAIALRRLRGEVAGARRRWPVVGLAIVLVTSATSLVALDMLHPEPRPGLFSLLYANSSLLAQGELWRAASAALAHVHVGHLALNMFALWALIIGRDGLEQTLGGRRVLAAYAFAVVVASLGVFELRPDAVVVGASGGVMGMLGLALVTTIAQARTNSSAGAGRRIGELAVWAAAIMLFGVGTNSIGLAGVKIANAAHLLGLAAGVVAGIACWRTAARAAVPDQTLDVVIVETADGQRRTFLVVAPGELIAFPGPRSAAEREQLATLAARAVPGARLVADRPWLDEQSARELSDLLGLSAYAVRT